MRGPITVSLAWRMRFDGEGHISDSSSSSRNSSRHLPFNLMPKSVSADFTPFPLPKYDANLGFGPVRLSHVPDIEMAQERMAASSSRQPTSTMLEDDTMPSYGFLGGLDGADVPAAAVPSQESGAFSQVEGGDQHPLGSYRVAESFPYIDRLECHRSVEDLLRQFRERPEREARTATVLDLASILQRCTNAELIHVLSDLGSVFRPDGNGLQFLAAKVVKYGRPYYAASELMKAYVHFVECATLALVEKRPARLAESPALFVELLHFLALIKIRQPNLWYSPNPNSPQNRADYSHPSGINRTIAYKSPGLDLLDHMTLLVVEGEESPLLQRATPKELMDMLGGFAGVTPSGIPEGSVANAILHSLFRRWGTTGYVMQTEEDVTQLERLYLLLNLLDIRNDSVLHALLGGDADGALQNSTIPISLHADVMAIPRGPDFFASVSRDPREAVHTRAMELYRVSIQASRDQKNDTTLQALVESGAELLMRLSDKHAATQLVYFLGLDSVALQAIPGFWRVAERLAGEAESRLPRTLTNLHDVAPALNTSSPYVTVYKGKRVHPLRTLLSDVPYVSSVDSVYLLHSSVLSVSVDSLLSVVQRTRDGKAALIITVSCCRALAAAFCYHTNENSREVARRTLETVAHELERGRAVLVPLSEELLIHDAGTYCDEDLMLWTVAAFFARHLPLVKVHTLMSGGSTARNPHHTLKGEHSPLTTSMDLYNKETPLLRALRSKELRAVTHHMRLQRAVRDRRSTLYNVNPARTRFVYRRDKALFDKYHVHARNLAPGFSQGALASDLRGLGFYTPDHTQVPYIPLRTAPVEMH